MLRSEHRYLPSSIIAAWRRLPRGLGRKTVRCLEHPAPGLARSLIMPEDASVRLQPVGSGVAIGKSWPAQFPTPRRLMALNTTPYARSPSPSICRDALFQFDPQNLRDFFLQFHYPLGALCPPLKPHIVPFQFPHPLS